MSRLFELQPPFHYDRRRPAAQSRRPRTVSGRGAAGTRLIPEAAAFLQQDSYSTSTGDTIVHAQQYYRGLRVYGSTMVVKRTGRRVTASASSFRPSDDVPTRPTIGPEAAVESLFSFLKRRKVVTDRFTVRVKRVLQDATLVERPTFVDMVSRFDGPVRMHLEVCPIPGADAELVWVVTCSLKDRRRFQAVVTAVGKRSRIVKVAQVNTCAFQASWVPVPGPAVVESFPAPIFAAPVGAPVAPSAWLPAGTHARGPNVLCCRPQPLVVEALGAPNVDNTFVWANLLHDFFGAFGFDGNSHAFEITDPLQVFRYSAASHTAGDFDNFADGSIPKMRLFDSPHGGTHGAGDPSVFIHEYSHGVSSRLVGGASVSEPFTTREAQGLAEGISDYFAVTVLNWMARARGTTVFVDAFGGLFKPGGGIRSYAGFTDPMPGTLPSDIYRIGRIWCAAMLDGRSAVAAVTSQDAADRFLWQALINMLKALKLSNHPGSGHLTLADSKQTLRSAAQAIESTDAALTGATTLVMAALTARNI